MTTWYAACTHCTARWWSPERFRLCPRCGHLVPLAVPVEEKPWDPIARIAPGRNETSNRSLEYISSRWPALKPHIREAIVTLVGTCEESRR
jgi:hypothetical protein